MVNIEERLPSAPDYNRLRAAVGWGTYSEDIIERALTASLYGVCAVSGDEVVGMARVIGDSGLVYYLQDVIVLPEYQRQGIGTKMMDHLMDYIHSNTSHNSIVGLMAAKGSETFYQGYGFTPRPNERLGCGMTMFIKSKSR
jgi:GNAT superfamily N-acetyltransferase